MRFSACLAPLFSRLRRHRIPMSAASLQQERQEADLLSDELDRVGLPSGDGFLSGWRTSFAIGSCRRVGLAVAPGQLVAVTARYTLRGQFPDRVHSRPMNEERGDDEWPELARALAQLADLLSEDDEPLEYHVALLPPLVRTKVLHLPDADRGELRRLLQREASRHFLDAPDDAVVDVRAFGGGLASGGSDCVAVSADRRVVRSVIAAIQESGARVGLVTAASWSLVEAATALDPELRSGERELVLDGGGRPSRLLVRDGRLQSVRPVLAEVEVRPGHRGAEASASLDAILPWSAASGADSSDGQTVSASMALAAFGTLIGREDGPLLLPLEDRNRWEKRGRLRSALLGGAAAVLLAACAVGYLWGLDREIESVEEYRTEIAPSVAAVRDARDAASRLGDLVTRVAELQSGRPDWTRLLADIGRHLPESAYLELLNASDTTVRLSGRARSPSSLIPRLEASSLVKEARLESVTREQGETTSAAFRIALTPVEPLRPGLRPSDEDASNSPRDEGAPPRSDRTRRRTDER